jgi:uncharacterized protein with GYD domain
MAKYLIKGNYTAEGGKGLMKDGGTKRREAVQKSMETLGGRIEQMYYAFGDVDVYVIAEAPDNVSAAALSLAVNASGVVQVRTVPLLTCEELDAAVHKTVSYRAPGQ